MKRVTLATVVLAASSILLLTSCATRPTLEHSADEKVSSSDQNIRQFSAKAEVLDRQSGRIHTVDLDFITKGRNSLRLDVTGTFATPVAAVVLAEQRLTCLLPRQKKYYQGPATPHALASVIGVRLDPEVFFNILFNEDPSRAAGWVCKKDSSNILESCDNPKTGQNLAWVDRQHARRKVVVGDDRFQVSMGFSQVPTKVQENAGNGVGVFSLTIPKGYTSLK